MTKAAPDSWRDNPLTSNVRLYPGILWQHGLHKGKQDTTYLYQGIEDIKADGVTNMQGMCMTISGVMDLRGLLSLHVYGLQHG